MRITHLWRYPVKSLAGEPLAQTRLDRGGMPFDRQYIIKDGEPTRKGNALTARVVSDLLAYQATVDADAVRVSAPDGRIFPVETLSSHLASALGRALWVEAAPAGAAPFHDAHDILVLNAASVRALEREWAKPLDPRRFRPNIMLDGDDLAPYVEDSWVGRRFSVGEAVLEGAALDQRCVLPTIDPQSLVRDPTLLRLIVERHNQCFGLYCRVLAAGNIALGDEWRLG
jgi:MOSC domain-containing protein